MGINVMSSFPTLELLGEFFTFIQILIEYTLLQANIADSLGQKARLGGKFHPRYLPVEFTDISRHGK